MASRGLLGFSGNAGDHSAANTGLLQQIFVSEGVAIADGRVGFSAAVGDQSAVCSVCKILLHSGSGILVIGDQRDELIVDGQSCLRRRKIRIDAGEQFVGSAFQFFHLRVFIRKGRCELESYVIDPVVEQFSSVVILECAVACAQPEELGMVKNQRVVTAPERGPEFVSCGVHGNDDLIAFLCGIFGECTFKQRVVDQLLLLIQMGPAVVHIVILLRHRLRCRFGIGKQHGGCTYSNQHCGSNGSFVHIKSFLA